MSDWSADAKPGERMFYSRKGEATSVLIDSYAMTDPDGGRPWQYWFTRPDGTTDRAHKDWFVWTEEEALARAKRYVESNR